MSSEPRATVVVVSRDRWSPALETLDHLLARTDPRHDVVVVEARAPGRVGACFARLEAAGRIRVVRRAHLLAGNEARNIGADGVRTEWVAFVENDSVMSDGWLERLIAAGEERGAASVYPTYLVNGPDGPIVHGLGVDPELDGPVGARRLREHHHDLGKLWRDVAQDITAVERAQAEPHAIVVRRELLEQIGGLDEGLLSWFDHVDLGLHQLRLGAPAWLVPDVTCTYLAPPPVALQDLPGFLLRWSGDWYQRSLDHLCDVWGLDRADPQWGHHARYRAEVRCNVLTPWAMANAAIEGLAVPVEHVATRWNDRARSRHAVATGALAVAD